MILRAVMAERLRRRTYHPEEYFHVGSNPTHSGFTFYPDFFLFSPDLLKESAEMLESVLSVV